MIHRSVVNQIIFLGILGMILFPGFASHADQVTTKGLLYDNVTVIDADATWLTFEMKTNEKMISKRLMEVDKIVLFEKPSFTKAEEHFEKKQWDEAIVLYEKVSAQKDISKWLKVLCSVRMKQSQTRRDQPTDVNEIKTKFQITSHKKTPPGPVQERRHPSVHKSPLSSPEALADVILKDAKKTSRDPRNSPGWNRMTTLQKKEALEQYQFEQKLAPKESDEPSFDEYQGKEVRWILAIADIRPNEIDQGFIVLATSTEKGYLVTAYFDMAQKKDLFDIQIGQLVTLQGELAGCTKKPKYPGRQPHFFGVATNVGKPFGVKLTNCTIKKVQDNYVSFFHFFESAQRVVYVIDRSGSMIDTFDLVRLSLLESIHKLNKQQYFQVVFFSDEIPLVFDPSYTDRRTTKARRSSPERVPKAPGRRQTRQSPKPTPTQLPNNLFPATDENKKKVRKFITTISAQGTSGPVDALAYALQIGRSPKGECVILLLTDGVFPEEEKILEITRRYNRGRRISINTFLIGNKPPQAVAFLQKVAKENNGKYVFVEPR
jgi:hypothetical protein